MASYEDVFPALRHIYLEDSWVLAVWPSERMLAFDLEAVLTASHPDYRGPTSGEQYDYRRARLVISGEDLRLELSGLPPATDRSGTTDLGNIDTWTVDETGRSVLTGDWGTASVRASSVDLTMAE